MRPAQIAQSGTRRSSGSHWGRWAEERKVRRKEMVSLSPRARRRRVLPRLSLSTAVRIHHRHHRVRHPVVDDDVAGRLSRATAAGRQLAPRRLRARGDDGTISLPRTFRSCCRATPMQILSTSAAFLIAAICAGLMGYAIQRGATCTVAAMDEVVRKKSINRLAALVEASLWVVGGLLIAQSLHARSARCREATVLPTRRSPAARCWASARTCVNKACVFGAIARLGSGEGIRGHTARVLCGLLERALHFLVSGPREAVVRAPSRRRTG